MNLNLDKKFTWFNNTQKPLLIAGPCSAESREQVINTAKELKKEKVGIYRAGIWKPRTRPGSFEGVGSIGLEWLKEVKQQIGLPVATEVANTFHVEEALKSKIDVLWIGARTSVNPFAVQEIANAVSGVDIPIMIKNPINPDLSLWIGAFERFNKVGINKLAAIHRGFSTHEKTIFRNKPQWQIPIELKKRIPELPIICDPSHIAGNRKLLYKISQKAIDLNFHGLMIESHLDPDSALSDKDQQVTPNDLRKIIDKIIIRKHKSSNDQFKTQIAELREQIDNVDEELLNLLCERMNISEMVGKLKSDNGVTILKAARWREILRNRTQSGEEKGLSKAFIIKLLKAIHQESINRQASVMEPLN